MKQDDTFPVLTAILSDQVGPVDLTAADSVKMIMKHSTGTPVVTGTCTIVTPQSGANQGKVTYDWVPADTSTTGTYDVEFQVTWNPGDIETFPNSGYKSLEIKADLGD
jgi:hypothetical protein